MSILHRLGALAGVLTVLVGLTAGQAFATPRPADAPSYLADHVTDTAGVLTGRVAEVEAAIDRLAQDTPVDLFVVFMDSFDGMPSEEWVNAAATASNLGVDDVLLAVAVDDRAFDVSIAEGGAVTADEITALVRTRVEPALSGDDWAGAAIAMADGLRATYLGETSGGGTPGQTPDETPSGTTSSLPAWLLGGGALLVVGGGAALAMRTRRRRDQQSGAGADPGQLSLPDLEKRAGAALVQVDDAIRSSEEDMGFAQAQFDLSVTDTFARALDTARQQATRAFELRKRLDDHIPETEPERRGMLVEILRIADAVNGTLAAQRKYFDELRTMETRAGDILQEMATRAREVGARVEGARSILASLALVHPAAALASISRNPEQATELLASAQAALEAGHQRLAAEDRAAAVVNARIAGQAIGQADRLLTAVAGANSAIAEAGPELERRLASLTSDLADARRLGASDGSVDAAASEAQAAVAVGRTAAQGGDLLGAVTRLQKAEEALDAALEPYRKREESLQRTASLAAQRIPGVEARISSVDTFIAASRGALDDVPRTRLSEARRLLDEARAAVASRPQTALQLLDQAERLAGEALTIAQQQRDAYKRSQMQGGPPRSGGVDLGSMILGGILGELLDDDRPRGGSRGGGFTIPSGRGPWGGSRGGGFGGSIGRSGGGGGRRGGFGGRF